MTRTDPTEADYRTLARYQNGPEYERHHYQERLEQCFVQFRRLR